MAAVHPLAPHQRVPRRRALRAGADLADRARHATSRPTRCGSSPPAPTHAPGQLRRPRRRVPRRARRSSCFGYGAYLIPARARRRRLALLLVPDAGCGLHEADRRRAALLRARARSSASSLGSTDVGGKTFDAGGSVGACARPRAGRVPQPHRLDHRPADADDAGGDPVDAVLVRPHVRDGATRQLAATVRRAASAGSAAGATSAAQATSSGGK